MMETGNVIHASDALVQLKKVCVCNSSWRSVSEKSRRCNHTREAQLTRVYIYLAVHICRLTLLPEKHCRCSVVSCFVMSPSHAFKDVSVDLSRGQPPIDLAVQPDIDFAKLSRLGVVSVSKQT